jgi:ABC-type branched-subunit amino acid transport system substrate-binding protein
MLFNIKIWREIMKKTAKILIALILIMSLMLGGCTTKVESAQGVTDTTVKVGNSIATSGPLAPVGLPYKTGMEAYFKMVNETGGVNGRTIEYVHTDDEFNPEKGKAAVDKMINDEKIFAFVGHFGTPVVGATLEDIKAVGIPAVYFATGTGILYNEKAEGNERALFPVQPVYPMEGRIIAAWAMGELEAKKVGVIYTNDDAGKDLLNGVTQELTAKGLELVSEQVAPNADDVSAAITKIKDSNVDAVVVAAIQGTFPQIVKELAKQAVNKPVLTTYVNADQKMTAAVAEAVNGQFDVYSNAWVDMTKPAIEDYREWVAKVSTEDLSNNAYAMTGWIAAHFFVEGLKRVDGDLTWEAYIDAMESAPIENPFGGLIDFSEGKRLGTQSMALVKMNPSQPSGWEPFIEFKSLEEILK